MTPSERKVHRKNGLDADAKREFDFACSQVCQRIDSRLKTHEQILISAAALFETADEISREDWHAFVRRENLGQHFSGIRGMGFRFGFPRTPFYRTSAKSALRAFRIIR